MIYLSHKERCLSEEEWIFQQDNATIHNASITCLKKQYDFLTIQRALQTSII